MFVIHSLVKDTLTFRCGYMQIDLLYLMHDIYSQVKQSTCQKSNDKFIWNNI